MLFWLEKSHKAVFDKFRIIPTLSSKERLKQFCISDIQCGIQCGCIILKIWTVWFLVAIVLPRIAYCCPLIRFDYSIEQITFQGFKALILQKKQPIDNSIYYYTDWYVSSSLFQLLPQQTIIVAYFYGLWDHILFKVISKIP